MRTVQNRPHKPTLIYDGQCGFCRIWVEYWKKRTGDAIDYQASSDASSRFPEIPAEDFREAVQLVRPDGTVASGAQAVFESLDKQWIYEPSPIVSRLADAAYRVVARHRGVFYHLTRLTFGKRIEPARYLTVQWLFLRLLAIIYAIAFGSLAVQVLGLIGSGGISPAQDLLGAVERSYGNLRFVVFPTLFWANAADPVLLGSCIAGVVLAVLLFAGRLERLALAGLYALYLSLSQAGGPFLTFQWDALLLEAGFLAIFFGRSSSGTTVVAWLYRLLVLRLYVLSGAVKLASGDATWHDLSALSYHFHTQPLPTVLAWYVDKLPAGVLQVCTFAVLVIELAAPVLMFTPRLWRLAGAWTLLVLQVLIFLTGNYTFFNLLTMALTLWMFDDQALDWLRRRVRPWRLAPMGVSSKRSRMAYAILAALLVPLGLTTLLLASGRTVPPPLPDLVGVFQPFQIVNPYGLFAVMTTARPEIILEGSRDGETWTPYEFRYKPGDVRRAPRWVAPYQPRLDWQMWFAALGNYSSNPWFVRFVEQLLRGSPAVEDLLGTNPFPGEPPRYIRAWTYEYRFSDAATRSRTGAWWSREQRGVYLPEVGLGPAESR